VPFSVASASINQTLGPLVQDGDLYTRWHTGLEQGRGDITLDLGATAEIKALEMLIGGYFGDYPRELRIETSKDQRVWSEAWSGPTALLVFSGALDRPRDVPISIPFQPHSARFIRLSQAGTEPWSIAELRVLR
jgi:hypothetical protein